MNVHQPPLSFLHCADLHLDSPLETVRAADEQIGCTLRDATFRALDNAVEVAVREQVDLMIVAGDVYDSADRSLRAQLRFRDALARAADAGIPCCVAHGNHDPLSGWEVSLTMPDGSHRFGGDDVQRVVIQRDGQAVAHVYGISYPEREVDENLAMRFQRADDAPFCIGVLHCNVGGDPNHDDYAPCSLEDLAGSGMDYWALGHVHARNVLRESGPAVVYPGNTQGRSVRELGPRGCYLVRVDESRRVDLTFVATDVVRWFEKTVDITDLASFDQLLEALGTLRDDVRSHAEGRAAVVRLHLAGRGCLHADLRREDTQSDLIAQLREGEPDRGDFVWIESLKVATRGAIDVGQRRRVEDFVGDFLRAAHSLRTHEDAASAIRSLLAARPEHKPIARDIEQLSEAELSAVLDAAEAMGLDYLLDD